MAALDSLTREVGNKFGIGAVAEPLLRELMRLITGQSGGIAGFLDRFKSAGLGQDVASWVGGHGETALPAKAVDSALGEADVAGIARRVGVAPGIVSTVFGFAIPKVIGLLTPGGRVSNVVPAEFQNFAGIVERTRPVATTPVGEQASSLYRWALPAIGAAILAALVWAFLPSRTSTVDRTAPVATTEPAPSSASTVAAAQGPRLWLSDDNGVVSYSGVVADDATKASVVGALGNAFGADKVRGMIAVDPKVGSASWLDKLGPALGALKANGLQALFDGNSLSVGGVADTARNKILASLGPLFGSAVTLGSLSDKLPELASATTGNASAALAALGSGYTATDLVNALNVALISFPDGSADLPATSQPFLQAAAARMKSLPSGTRIEIAGHTDNAGESGGSTALSQQRADAVRNALVQAGVDPSMLAAKGYGPAQPIAPNDTAYGRFRNNRIEFSVVSG